MILIWLIGGILLVSFGFIVVRGAPYVPTHAAQLDVAFDELYKLTDKDTVVDLGSGDGIVLAAVVARGAGAIGYELNPILALISRFRLRHSKRAKVLIQDFLMLSELPLEVTVVYAFTTGHNIEEIGRKMEQWARDRPLHLISYGFLLRDKPVVASKGAMQLYSFGSSQT